MGSVQEQEDSLPKPEPVNQEETPTLVLEKRSTLGEIWDFLRVRKRFWLAPIIIALILLGGLIVLAGSMGAASPFIYAF